MLRSKFIHLALAFCVTSVLVPTLTRAATCYRDKDGDGFGTINNTEFTDSTCSEGYVANHSDCNDNNASINPNGTELCSGIDENCNGALDDGFPTTAWYVDADRDGHGSMTIAPVFACVKPPGAYVASSDDCNDGNRGIYPGHVEYCNDVDENCDGSITDSCAPCPVVMTGDYDQSGEWTSADLILMVNGCFKGGPPAMPCFGAADVNCSGTFTSSDIIFMVQWLFKAGAQPCDMCFLIPMTYACP